MTRLPVVLALGVALTSALGGCGGDGNADQAIDRGIPDLGPEPEIDFGMEMGEGNDTIDEAEPIAADGTPVNNEINPAGDNDFFSFEGVGGTWVLIDINANADDNPEMVDTVIRLYGPGRTVIAENDDAVPRANTDSELILRLPEDGTYYIEVLEFSEWDDGAPEGGPRFDYELVVGPLNTDQPNLGLDAETGDDAESATAVSFEDNLLSLILGDFDEAGDIDVFSFTVPTNRNNVSARLMPGGADGYGSTNIPGRLWVTDSTGEEIIARLVPADRDGTVTISPTLSSGNYLLWVEQAGAGGANEHYVLKFTASAENTFEDDDDGNDTLAGAEILEQNAAPPFTSAAFLLSRLDGADDIDYWRVTVDAGDGLQVVCGSRENGSGLQNMRIEVRDDADGFVAGADEREASGIVLDAEAIGIPAAGGDFYLRFSATGQDEDVSGNWIRCGVRTTAP